ncbi:MAG: peptidyl-prolyl cis-trans isomerase [Solirubrobacterales bacterium]
MSGKAGNGSIGGGRAAARRLGLLAFGALFILLFAIVAIAEGVGDPSIPAGDAVLVEGISSEIGEISEAEVEHSIEVAAVQMGEEKPPSPGDPQYQERLETAMAGTLERAWIQGLAEEWGIEVTEEEVARELKKAKQQFKSEKEFQDYLDEAHFTPADVDTLLELELLKPKLQERLAEGVPEPSQEEIEDYYEAAKSSQYTRVATRDTRSIVNQEREKAEKALTRLEKDNSPKAWDRVAKEFSEDAATMQKGGLQTVNEEFLGEPLKDAVFGAPEGQLEGPLKAPNGFVVFEVVSSTPEGFRELEEVEAGIEGTLAQRLEEEYFTQFSAAFNAEWTVRTFCAEGYATERCANFKGDGRPETATPACYEADPEEGRPEACPAPVAQSAPALPGSVTPLEPQGKPLPQRPQPVPTEQSEEASAVPPPIE